MFIGQVRRAFMQQPIRTIMMTRRGKAMQNIAGWFSSQLLVSFWNIQKAMKGSEALHWHWKSRDRINMLIERCFQNQNKMYHQNGVNFSNESLSDVFVIKFDSPNFRFVSLRFPFVTKSWLYMCIYGLRLIKCRLWNTSRPLWWMLRNIWRWWF